MNFYIQAYTTVTIYLYILRYTSMIILIQGAGPGFQMLAAAAAAAAGLTRTHWQASLSQVTGRSDSVTRSMHRDNGEAAGRPGSAGWECKH